MKSKLCLTLLKAALLIAPLSLYFSSLTIAQACDRQFLAASSVSSGISDYHAELPQGSLMVYSATDQFDDGGLLYYAHSSYTVYTTNGKVVKNVENRISRSDQIPEIVTLPIGSYIVEARSEKGGYVQVNVAIKAGRRTTVDLDSRENSPTTEHSAACREVAQRRTWRGALAQFTVISGIKSN
jgi:hypothetical protein